MKMRHRIFRWLAACLLLAGTWASLQAQVTYHLTGVGTSHLYWPFGDGTSFTNLNYGSGDHRYCEKLGSRCHDYSDYFAQDWWITEYLGSCNGSAEQVLGKAFNSPVYGRVMFVDNSYSSATDPFGCQVIIEVMDQWGFWTGHALRVIHLKSGSAVVSEGTIVTPGMKLAEVGNTGPNSGDAHAHIALYERIDQKIPARNNETGRERLAKGLTISDGSMCDDTVPGTQDDNRFASPFVLDATTNGGNFCIQAQVHLNGTVNNRYVCEATQYATVNGKISQTGEVNIISPSTTIDNLSVEDGGKLHIKIENNIPQKSGPVLPTVEEDEEKGFVVYPNPSSGEVQIAFEMQKEADYELEVYDVMGRKMKTVAAGRLFEGAHTRSWDGRDASGGMAPSGQYLIVLRTEKAQLTRRISLQR